MGKRPCTLPTSSSLPFTQLKSLDSNFSTISLDISPSCCREDVAIVRSCPKALVNLEQGRTTAPEQALSRTEMHVELEELEHLVSSFIVECVVVKNV